MLGPLCGSLTAEPDPGVVSQRADSVGSAMRHVSARVVIRADRSVVWRLVAEFGHWPSWGLSVRGVEAPVDEVAPGVQGRVRTVIGIRLPFLITSVVPGESWTWKVAGIPATSHTVVDRGDGRLEVSFGVPWVAAPYLVVLWLSLRKLRALAETTV